MNVVKTHVVIVEIGGCGEETAVSVALGFGKCQSVDVVKSEGFVVSKHDVSEQLLSLSSAAIGLPVCPNSGGQELLAFYFGVAISAKYRQAKAFCKTECEFGMSADVGGVVLSAAIHERHGMIDLVTVGKAIISSIGIFRRLKSWVEGCRRIEGLLYIIDCSRVLVYIAKHSHVDFQQSIPHVLVHTHVAGEVSRLFVQNDAGMIDITQRHTVAVILATTSKCNVMVLDERGLLDGLLPISVEAVVDEH